MIEEKFGSITHRENGTKGHVQKLSSNS